MTGVWGLVLAAGLVLTTSPWLWPRTAGSREPRSTSSLQRLLGEAGVRGLTPAGVVLLSAAAGLILGVLVLAITRLPALGLLALVGGAAAPTLLLRGRRDRRARELRAHWPDVCDMLVASVRAGVSLPDAVAALADTGPAGLRPAFAAFRRDYAASGHFGSSAARLKDALADPTADRIVESLRMARDVGGTALPSVLRSLSAAVRAEAAVRGEATARQSWIRGAAYVGVIAPWAILGLMLTRPDAAGAYATPGGLVLVLTAAAVSIIAFRLMLRIGSLARPRRWFG